MEFSLCSYLDGRGHFKAHSSNSRRNGTERFRVVACVCTLTQYPSNQACESNSSQTCSKAQVIGSIAHPIFEGAKFRFV